MNKKTHTSKYFYTNERTLYLPGAAEVVEPTAEHELGASSPDARRLRVTQLELKVFYVRRLAPVIAIAVVVAVVQEGTR